MTTPVKLPVNAMLLNIPHPAGIDSPVKETAIIVFELQRLAKHKTSRQRPTETPLGRGRYTRYLSADKGPEVLQQVINLQFK